MAAIDALFDTLLERGGSDLHLAVGSPPIVRARGGLSPVREAPIDLAEMEALIFEIVSRSEEASFRSVMDLDFAYSYGQKARFRANYFYKTTGPAAVFRVIPTIIKTLAELGCPEVIQRTADRRAGLVLVTGPTGSGKSTTLAAMIDHINETRACHVLTIEDPVEFVHQPKRAQITHREVGHDASSFAAAIRVAGRESADVILVGELRTNETMKLALQLASFGVLVMGTLHTNGAAPTIDRIINAFPAEEQPQVRGLLSESLVAVIAQQLVRTKDGKGRVAAHEILVGSSALASMIREGKTYQIPNLMQGGQGLGMQTMDMALERLVKAGIIAAEEALEKANDKDAFVRMMGEGG